MAGQTGTRTVTIDTTGSGTLTVTTVADTTDEADGSISATVQSGGSYVVGSASSASVSVADDDDPPAVVPAVSIAGGGGITEGGAAVFTVTATPKPATPLTVTVSVGQTGSYAVAGQTGTRTVTIGTSGTESFSVATVDDTTDEADGSISATLQSGQGYTVGSPGAAAVAVTDDDDPPVVEPTVSISAGDAITEGGTATFTITASPAPQSPLTVTLQVGQTGDYAADGTTGTKTVVIPTGGSAPYSVTTVGDDADESNGAIVVSVSQGQGYTVGSSFSASVTVSDDDEPQPTSVEAPSAEVLPNGHVLVTWPAHSHGSYIVRAISVGFKHPTRQIQNHDENSYLFEDLQPGRWIIQIYTGDFRTRIGRGWLIVTVP